MSLGVVERPEAPPAGPPAVDELERGHARSVQVFCVGLAALTLVNAASELIRSRGPSGRPLGFGFVAELATCAACLGALRLVRSGRLTAAYRTLAVVFLGTLAVSFALRGLAYHELFFLRTYALLLLLPALLLGRRALWASFAFLVLCFAVGWAHDKIWSRPIPPRDPAFGVWGQAALVALLFCVLADRFGAALRDAYAASVARRAELERAVERLREEAERRSRAESLLVQSQRLEALGRLSGGIAHDFNNVLFTIRGFADLAAGMIEPGHAARADLDELRAATERGVSLTRELLAFAAKQPVEPCPMTIEACVRSLVPMLEQLVGERIRMAVRTEPFPWVVRMDPTHCEQILLNLAANARDAMPRGGTMSIETRNVSDGGEWVELSVSDEGTGIDAETLPRIFEPFFTTKARGKGTGLGLATCHGIAQQAGGTIHATSLPGRGTTIAVRLPRYVRREGDSVPGARLEASGP